MYNRCHLIGYQLSGENYNSQNVITGTRYLNIEGMLPFENMLADYIKETNNHVMYRVTPIFKGTDVLAYGVIMEGYSVEDKGNGINYNVFCYNVQPGISIDYRTGNSSYEQSITEQKSIQNSSDSCFPTTVDTEYIYIGNKNTKKFHYINCISVDSIKESNKEYLKCPRDVAIANGYKPCTRCNP